jgi:hypothetical protein
MRERQKGQRLLARAIQQAALVIRKEVIDSTVSSRLAI